MQRLRGGLEIDPGVRRERKTHLVLSDDRIGADDGPQFRQQGAESRIRGAWQTLRPQGVHQGIARRGLPAVRRQVRKQQSSLPSRKRILYALAADARNEAAAELDARGGILRQAFTKIPGRRICHNRGELTVRGVTRCEK